jgi:nuclear pore complex protein Nup160
MYQHALKLKAAINDGTSFVEVAQAQLEAIMIAINALSLVDSRNAWIVIPKSLSNTVRFIFCKPRFALNSSKVLHRRPALNHVPEGKYSSRKHDGEIVHLSDMQYDCALLRAQIDLIRKDPSILTSQGKSICLLIQCSIHIFSTEFLIPPALVVMRLVNMNFYEQALTTARTLGVNMTDTFSQLTVHCLRLKNTPDGTS